MTQSVSTRRLCLGYAYAACATCFAFVFHFIISLFSVISAYTNFHVSKASTPNWHTQTHTLRHLSMLLLQQQVLQLQLQLQQAMAVAVAAHSQQHFNISSCLQRASATKAHKRRHLIKI